MIVLCVEGSTKLALQGVESDVVQPLARVLYRPKPV